ncbi:MAG TPA: hypothetical protein VFX96_13515 [Pyrinomonadaceae bacterium]|nr:hypothetical protein [Pyrinomonadaceae bacterium]
MSASYSEVRTVAVSISAAISAFAALCLLTASESVAFAQGGGGRRPSPSERRIERLNRQGELYDLEKSSRDMKGKPSSSPADLKHAKEVTNQIQHDFKGLQDGYNAIALAMSEKDGLARNHDAVFRAVAEIKKCSSRLKTNLALPKPKDEKDEKTQIKSFGERPEDSLLLLRKHIYDFVTNPLFESLTVLDLEQGRKASRDLDKIIALSETLSKKR